AVAGTPRRCRPPGAGGGSGARSCGRFGAVVRPADGVAPAPRRAAARRAVRSGVGRLRARAEVPAGLGAGASSSARRRGDGRGDGAPEEWLEPFEHGRFVLRGELDEETRSRLLAVRSRRPQPGLDDKAIASWNGLALAALAEAGRRLGRPDFVEEARALAEFLL